LSGGNVLDHLQGICAKVRENLADEEEIGWKICTYLFGLQVVRGGFGVFQQALNILSFSSLKVAAPVSHTNRSKPKISHIFL